MIERLIRAALQQRLIVVVLAAALLSTFLTNDVALFIVVPLTLTLKKWCAIPVNRLIIFEALAVNAGSLLTPIGNPQNLYLFSNYNMNIDEFIIAMQEIKHIPFENLMQIADTK